MLEHLGLGVVLTLEDNFTPQANKALSSFQSLQNGAENMVQKLQTSMMSLQNVMLAGFSFREIGMEVERLGSKIEATFAKIYQGTAKAGAHWETLTKTMSTFYGAQTDAVMKKGFDLASKTPFEIDQVQDALKSLKAVRVDALKEYDAIAQGGQKFKKTFLEYVGDLGAFNPTQGMEGAMYALRNLIGGNKRSLDMRFDVNSEMVLGEKWSSDPMKIQEQFVKFMDKLAPNMMKNLEGTYDQLVSNMKDKWTLFMKSVGDSGAFDAMKKTLMFVSGQFDRLSGNGNLDRFAKMIGKTLADLWQPMDKLIKGVMKLTDWFITFSEKHPHLAKLALGFMAVSGGVLVLTGWLMKFTGGILVAFASISSLVLNLRLMSAMGVTATTAFEGLGGAITGLITKMSVFALAGAGIFFAWQKDLGGFRTKTQGVFDGITTGWGTALKGIKDNNFRSALMESLGGNDNNLAMKYNIKLPPLAKIFAGKFLKVIAVAKAFWQVFTGTFNDGVMNFSKKDWDLYKEVGIDGLVRGMVVAKDRINHFFEGFKDGLTTTYDMMKTFVGFVWKPIKLMIDSVKEYTSAHPKGLVASLLIGKDGMDANVADKQISMAERLGKAIGIITGALVGMKVVSSLTTIIATPFRNLFGWLSKIGDKTAEIKAMAVGGGMGGMFSVMKPKTPYSSWNDRADAYLQPYRDKDAETQRRVDLYNEFDRRGMAIPKELDTRTRSQKFQALVDRDGYLTNTKGKSSSGGYINIDKDDAYRTYANYNLDPLLGDKQLQVAKRSQIMRSIFGDKFYAQDSAGNRNRIGRFGGLLGYFTGSNDRQMEDRLTQVFSRSGTMPTEDSLDGLSHRPVLGSYAGRVRDMNGAYPAQLNSQLLGLRRSITGRANSQFDRFSSVRQREILSDYNGLLSRSASGQLSASERERLNYYNSNGLSQSTVGSVESMMQNDRRGSSYLQELRTKRSQSQVLGDTTYRRISGVANQEVYGDNRQSLASRLLTGQRLYTVNQGEDGTMSRQYVGRRGGLFRRQSSDATYRPSLGTRIRSAITGSRPVSAISGFGSNLRNSIMSSIMTNPMAIGARFGMSRIGAGFSRVGGWASSQLARVGYTPRPVAGGFRGVARGAVRGIGRGAMAVGRGAVGGVRAVGRGIGALGGGLMRMLPGALMWGALGVSAFRGIAGKGAGLDAGQRGKLGIGKDDSNFVAGLKYYQDAVKKMDLAGAWRRFSSEGGKAWRAVVGIGRTLWSKLKPELPHMMKQAFEGIKGIAIITWTWIKTDGIKLFGSMASSAMKLLGDAFKWVATNGGKAIGAMLEWIITTGFPKLVSGIISLGAFIIKHIPDVLRGLVTIGIDIFKGLFEGIKTIFEGIGSFLWEALKGALSGLKGFILNILAEPIRSIPVVGNQVADSLGLPKHHGGLWMSPNEHTAIIKDDETVLPSDKSRKLDTLLSTGSPVVRETGGKGDNSIKIDKVEIVVKADRLSPAEAREQARQIIRELEKLKRERQVRNHEDIATTGLNF